MQQAHNYGTTGALIEGLKTVRNLGRICGFGNKNCVVTREGTSAGGKLLRIVKKRSSLPSEATFSRAFREFAESELGDIVHKAMVGEYLSEQIIGHISRDATAIVGNEKPAKKDKEEIKAKPAKKGRPKKGEVRPDKEEKRLNLQSNQIPNAFGTEALKDIPTVCNVGSKTNAQGYKETWRGYKFHIDTNDCGLPITTLLTSASLHDSQVAIPMMKMTTERVTYLYDLMDAAYDAKPIHDVSRALGHVPSIDRNSRRGDALSRTPSGLRH